MVFPAVTRAAGMDILTRTPCHKRGDKTASAVIAGMDIKADDTENIPYRQHSREGTYESKTQHILAKII